jgi:acyl CoA:acetate/3-ketoacid CoA transferase beta subunit
MAVITSAGVYDFEPVSKRMRIKSLHPEFHLSLHSLQVDLNCSGQREKFQ